MTHDAFWLSIGSDHRAENAVQLEVRRNLGGSQACGGCPCLRSIPCWPRSRLAFAWGLTRFGCPTHFLLPGRHPELASPPACSEHAGLLRRRRQPIDRFICAWAGCDDPAFLCLYSGNKKPRQLSTPPGSCSSLPRQSKSFRPVCSEVQLRVMRSSV